MKFVATTVLAAAILLISAARSETLIGKPGKASGNEWCAAWWDLQTSRRFVKGEKLCVAAQGGPSVFVRLLPDTSPYDGDDGLLQGIRTIPSGGGTLAVNVPSDTTLVKQVSIHSCESAWGTSIPGNNTSGPIT